MNNNIQIMSTDYQAFSCFTHHKTGYEDVFQGTCKNIFFYGCERQIELKEKCYVIVVFVSLWHYQGKPAESYLLDVLEAKR